MKLMSFRHSGTDSWGIVSGDGVIDVASRSKNDPPQLQQLLQKGLSGQLDRLSEIAASHTADVALSDVEFLRPVLYPEKTICVGVNYGKRNAEYKDNSDAPRYPSIFTRTPDSLTGHGQAIKRPPESPQFDYEGEIVIVIGKTGRRIPESNVPSHIAGLSIMNEGSVRDWLRHGKFNVTQGKNFDCSGAIGPWLVSADEFDSFDNLQVTTKVNGEVRQDDDTSNLMFPFTYLVNYISTFTTLKPGDVIATGTPVGAGARFDPPKWLVPGDTVEVTVSGVGTLVNSVVDEAVS